MLSSCLSYFQQSSEPHLHVRASTQQHAWVVTCAVTSPAANAIRGSHINVDMFVFLSEAFKSWTQYVLSLPLCWQAWYTRHNFDQPFGLAGIHGWQPYTPGSHDLGDLYKSAFFIWDFCQQCFPTVAQKLAKHNVQQATLTH